MKENIKFGSLFRRHKMTRTTAICVLFVCMCTSCAMQTICPAYQSAFILDPEEQKQTYSLFVEVDGTFVPKKPYGFKFRAEEGDSLMEKFMDGTKGKGFRVQKGRVHSFEKYGFEYENRVKEGLLARVFGGKEKAVLENPYLFDRITKKRPYYKLDQLETKIVHFNSARYDSLLGYALDTANYRVMKDSLNSLPAPIQAQYVPIMRGGFNVEQDQYNKMYGDYFLKLEKDTTTQLDSAALVGQTVNAEDTVTEKKGLFGRIFKKKKKKEEDKEEEKEDPPKNNNDNANLRDEEEE